MSDPRLEFYLSSSPCEHCRELFLEMREQLNQKEIHIPILIYYVKPFLTSEISKSQILLVSFDKKIIETGICLQTSYDSTIERQIINYRKFIDSKRVLTLDPPMYKVISSMLSENTWTFQKINFGLKSLVRDNHNSTDLAWLLTFFERVPNIIKSENRDELGLIKEDILQLFKTGRFKQKSPSTDLMIKIKHLIDLWIDKENNNTFITYVIFEQLKELFKDFQPHLESTKLFIMMLTSLVMVKLLILPDKYDLNRKSFSV